MAKAMYRMYGTLKGVSPQSFEELSRLLPFDTVAYHGGVVDIEHENGWVDHKEAVGVMADVLEEQGWGALDVIDNAAWEVHRYTIRPGGYDVRVVPVDNVLDAMDIN